MKLIIDIPEDTHERITRPDRLFTDNDINKVCWAVYNGTPIPDNATNGDCVRKLFCKGIYRTSVRTNVSVEFKRDWWNALYQKDGNE